MKILLLTLCLGAAAITVGCGQTGPLYLPDNPSKTVDGR